jgi:short-subunit dehydrogenase
VATKLKPLRDQVMVITGASSGIGMATAEAAAAEGAKLVLAARSEHALAELVESLTDEGVEATHVVADVADTAQLEKVAHTAIDRFGRIDTWVNNAGVSIYGRLTEITEEDNRRLFDVNFWGVVNGSLIAVRHLRRHGGALINVGSEVSESVVPLQGMYSASKHAVKGFTDALRIELDLEQAPIAVCLIQPTAVDTPYPEHAKNYMAQEPKLPSPRIDPRAVAKAILDAATHVRRDVKVGLMAKLATNVAHLLPRLADRMAKKLATQQQRDEPPRRPQGTLYEAGEAGRTHGRTA